MSGVFRSGFNRPTTVPVATAQAVEIGDLVAITAGVATRASEETWVTNEATTRANYVAKFIGVANQKKVATVARIFGNSNDNIMGVNQEGEYDYTAVSDSYVVGDLLGPAKDTGNNLLDSTLKKVTAVTEATHVCTKNSGAAATTVRGRIRAVALTL